MIKIFIDFDGTITRQDVGDAMFVTFGGKQCFDFINKYRSGKISATECFRKECAACSGTELNALNSFLDSQKIDHSFREFIDFCGNTGFEYFILSDGMDYYIERILERQSIKQIPVFTNHLELIPLNGGSNVMFQTFFPYTDEVCDRCACCKRNQMLTHSGDEDIIVYIGEGFSDKCPVRYADVVFAKDELLKYCQQENISFFEYRTFADITTRMNSLFENKLKTKHFGLKKRRQAQLAAHDLFIGG